MCKELREEGKLKHGDINLESCSNAYNIPWHLELPSVEIQLAGGVET